MRTINYCLLGLIGQGDCSGYDIRKILTSTPMRRYSDSPGSIYPALRRLEKRKLVVSTRDVGNGRGRVSYRLTQRGRIVLRTWLRSPVTGGEIADHFEDVMLRLSFQHLIKASEKDLKTFLRALNDRAEDLAANLREFIRRSTGDYPSGALLALSAGLNVYVSLARWSKEQCNRPMGRRAAPNQASKDANK